MNNLYKLINLCWQTSKMMFEDSENFRRMNQIANETVKSVSDGKDKKFVKAMVLAVIEYIEDEWRDKRERDRGNSHEQSSDH